MRLHYLFPLLLSLVAFLNGYLMGNDMPNLKLALAIVVILSLAWALFWRTACRNKPPGAARTAFLALMVSLVWMESGCTAAASILSGTVGYGLLALCGTAYLICLASPAQWAETLIARIETWPS